MPKMKEYKIVFIENKTAFIKAKSREEAINLVDKYSASINPNLRTFIKVEETKSKNAQ